MTRKAIEKIPDETQPVFVEPELEQVASMSTLELDLLPTPELDVEALAA